MFGISEIIGNMSHRQVVYGSLKNEIMEKAVADGKIQSWYPLGGKGHTAELLGDNVISEIAAAHGKSSAQVILRWNLQKGVVVIPGSSNPGHIQENTELFDFELTAEEMERNALCYRNNKAIGRECGGDSKR